MPLPRRLADNLAAHAPQERAADQAGASVTPDVGDPGVWKLGGAWTVQGLGALARDRPAMAKGQLPTVLDGSRLLAIDSAGAWALQRWLGSAHASPVLRDWPARAGALMQQVQAGAGQVPQALPRRGVLQRLGRQALAAASQGRDFLAFIGQLTLAGLAVLRRPGRLHLRSVLCEIEIGGFDALPIIGLTAFLLGVVVAYQGADQLKHYGANVFVVELVGYAMLREFAPLIGAIIIAGRSGSAYAAQLGTMVVTEEIDAMRTLGLDPLQRLVLPKLIALAIALPLLTVFADLAGVFGGMVMARSQLGIGFGEFADRFGRVMQGSALLIGVGKAGVFALIIVAVGCFQGLRTSGSADSVGRQTTQAVVQAIFLVIVADALFSVAFNLLGI
jgi:phospholipid/cholesterol/gamma-HCH transport system permease protein